MMVDHLGDYLSLCSEHIEVDLVNLARYDALRDLFFSGAVARCIYRSPYPTILYVLLLCLDRIMRSDFCQLPGLRTIQW